MVGDVSWREFWNTDNPIYVSARHKTLHDLVVAADIARLIPGPGAAVLDHGCGDTIAAADLLRRAGRLFLCDGAPTVRSRLAARYAAEPRILVIAPEEIEAAIGDGSLDAVVANSLLQYLPRDEVAGLLDLWHRKLKAGGRLVVGDVIPPDVGPMTDALALLRFGFRGGFLIAALAGLVRTAFSDYRKLRGEIGLSTWSEAEMLALLEGAGYAPQRHKPNIGHNQARMTFVAAKPG